MKIDRIEVFGVAVPLIGEYKNAYRSKTVQKSAIVRITASGGAIGLGNIDPSPGYSRESIEDSLRVLETRRAPLMAGMDPTNIHRVLQKIEPAVEGYFDAKAAIECDIAGIADGDEIEIDLAAGRLAVAARGIGRTVAALPPAVQQILAAGGLIAYLREHPDWQLA